MLCKRPDAGEALFARDFDLRRKKDTVYINLVTCLSIKEGKGKGFNSVASEEREIERERDIDSVCLCAVRER